MDKILIVGDSFSSFQLANNYGWPALLAQKFKVTNLSQPGIGEYKILQKLQTQNLDLYDLIIVSHTSPYRVHCQENPMYPPNHLYRKSDIIFADAEQKKSTDADAIVTYFTKIFDPDYYKFIHYSCCSAIDNLTKTLPVLHITHFEWDDLYPFEKLINFYSHWTKNKGSYNHYTVDANQYILETILEAV